MDFIYLHCDPTAGHYVKLILDEIFDARNFRTEIIWKRSSAHSDTKQGRKQHGHIHDTIFFYTKSNEWKWNPIHPPYDEEYLAAFYKHVEPETGRRYRLDNLTAAKPGGDVSYEFIARYPERSNETCHAKIGAFFPKQRGTPVRRVALETQGI